MDIFEINEGIGGAYERLAYSAVIKKLAAEHGCRSILELGATYIAGVPGFNSCLLADAGFDVTILVHPRDLAETQAIWSTYKTPGKVTILEGSDLLSTQFSEGQFDLVWNHLAFEHYPQPQKLVAEMSRIAKKIVINLTLSPWNVGFPLHWLGHKLHNKPWDHGYFGHTTIAAMEKAHQQENLVHLESGGCDVPPWMDTVDAQLGGTMTYLDYAPGAIKKSWKWNSVDPKTQNHGLIKMLLGWEAAMPDWFRRCAAHHLYVASKK